MFQHAHALELLADNMKEGAHVLDVGSGSGYLTACMAIMVSGNMASLESRHDELNHGGAAGLLPD